MAGGLELGDLQGPFQFTPFYDSVIVWNATVHSAVCKNEGSVTLYRYTDFLLCLGIKAYNEQIHLK